MVNAAIGIHPDFDRFLLGVVFSCRSRLRRRSRHWSAYKDEPKQRSCEKSYVSHWSLLLFRLKAECNICTFVEKGGQAVSRCATATQAFLDSVPLWVDCKRSNSPAQIFIGRTQPMRVACSFVLSALLLFSNCLQSDGLACRGSRERSGHDSRIYGFGMPVLPQFSH